MRIAVVTETFLPQVNGVTHSILRVLEHLQSEGHEALVIAPSAGGEVPREYAGARVIGLPSVSLPGYAGFRVATSGQFRLEKILTDHAPDVVHLAAPFALGYKASQVGHRLGLPMVSIYQTEVPTYASRYGVPQLEPVLWRRVRNVHNLATRTLAPSSFAAGQLAEQGVERVQLWGRGVDSERFHPDKYDPQWRARMAPNGEKIIVYVGRLAAEKQVDDLHVLTDLPNTKLVIIGDGPKRAELEEFLPHAVFLGQQTGDAVPTAMASADLFVHTGELETFCQSIQEALASGTPVVAPARGGPLDLVDPSHTGWLYPPGDLAAMRGHVRDLLGDDFKRKAFGLKGRAAVEHRTWPYLCSVLMQHYREVIAEVGERAPVPAWPWSLFA
ncbi:glycosyltransferase family 4 protein [Microlunatus sp. Y2014]|uniref:glycosyltransferase family 4 protein n=1 Tax=Microlunatus sp. Y2014 TaxID=3418488 RepID=UPI003DA762F8